MKNQAFGIQMETTGIGRERTAKAIAAYFGPTARFVGRHLGGWHIPMPDGRKWGVERDGSVIDSSAEVISPVCRWNGLPWYSGLSRPSGRLARERTAPAVSTYTSLSGHTPRSACGGWSIS